MGSTSQCQLASFLLNEKKGAVDQDRARELLDQAVRQGHAPASHLLSQLHFEQGNAAEGLACLLAAAEKGYEPAQFMLGEAYLRGQRLDKDTTAAVMWFERAAANGSGEACFHLGNCCRDGVGVSQDTTKAANWYERGARAFDAACMREFGRCLLKGNGVEQNTNEATSWLAKAALLNDVEAIRELGLCYESGNGVPRNPEESLSLFRKAADRGDAISQYKIGCFYGSGTYVAQDIEEALRWIGRAADSGYVEAQAELARCYLWGAGAIKDEAEAASWAYRAALQDSILGQLIYSHCLSEGIGIEKNRTEAIRFLRLAADQGSNLAQFYLGARHLDGDGVGKNHEEAFRLFTLAAEGGYTDAQVQLGYLYADGKGTSKNSGKAVRWFTRAAEKGDPHAQFELGLIHRNGTHGVEKNFSRSLEWYTRAAKQGHLSSQHNLSLLYLRGEGVPKNTFEAYVWASLAATGGDTQSTALRDSIERQMTREQVASAQTKAAAFVPTSEDKQPAGLEHQRAAQAATKSGSGFFITKNGYFVTNFHVIRQADEVYIRANGKQVRARVVQSDKANDLAILKAEGSFSALHVRGSRAIKMAEKVATVGFPHPDVQGVAPKYSSGEVAALSGIADDPKFLQVSIPIQPGNSGGPLVDASGSVVGVMTGQINKLSVAEATGSIPENVSYALKGTLLLGILESIPEVASNLLAGPSTKNTDPTAVAANVESAVGMVIATHR